VNRKFLILGVIVLTSGMGLLYFMRGRETPDEKRQTKDPAPNIVEISPESQNNAGLEVEKVTERPIRGLVKTTGIISPDQSRVAHMFPLAKGIVEKVYVQLGDKVSEGQPLVLYDNIELGQLIGEFLSLRGGLERVQAQEEVAGKSLDRAKSLIDVQAIAQSEFELRQAEYQQAKATVQSQMADIARVEEQVHRYGLSEQDVQALGGPSEHATHRTASHNILKAPRSGVVTTFEVSQGEVVDPGKELMTIVDTSVVWVLADVYEKDLAAVHTGTEAQITVASYPDHSFAGKITYISDSLDPASRTAKLRCVVPNGDGRFKLEMFATVEIPEAGVRSALAIPEQAIQQLDADSVVFVQRDATHYEKRVIQAGERGSGWAEVLKGLGKGENVVTQGTFYLKSALLREQIGGGE